MKQHSGTSFIDMCLFVRGVYFVNNLIIIVLFATIAEGYLNEMNHKLWMAKDHKITFLDIREFSDQWIMLRSFIANVSDSLVVVSSVSLTVGLLMFIIGFADNLKHLPKLTTDAWPFMYNIITWIFNFLTLAGLCAKNQQLHCAVSNILNTLRLLNSFTINKCK